MGRNTRILQAIIDTFDPKEIERLSGVMREGAQKLGRVEIMNDKDVGMHRRRKPMVKKAEFRYTKGFVLMVRGLKRVDFPGP